MTVDVYAIFAAVGVIPVPPIDSQMFKPDNQFLKLIIVNFSPIKIILLKTDLNMLKDHMSNIISRLLLYQI